MFAAVGHLGGAERTGRPRKFTPAVLDRALCLLIEDPHALMTGKQLLERVKEEGHVDRSACVSTFLRRLKEHVGSQGHRLITNSTKTIFYITPKDAKEREQFSAAMMKELEQVDLSTLIFIDETQLEESPHPKGKMV